MGERAAVCAGWEAGWHEELDAAPAATWITSWPTGRFYESPCCDECLDIALDQAREERVAVTLTPLAPPSL